MKAKKEVSFEINGKKSRVNCLKRVREASQRSWGIRYHFHNYIEFLYAEDAECEIWINGECHNFSTGDFAVLNSNQPHCIFAKRSSEYMCVQFSPEILYGSDEASYEFMYAFPFLLGNSYKTVFKKGEIPDMGKICKDIFYEWDTKEYAYELKISSYILLIFADVLKALKKSDLYVPVEKSDETFKKALYYIIHNFKTVTEKEAAKVCNLSYYHFSHIFKKNTGKTFGEYVNSLKISEGERLLISTDKKLTEIAMLAGFSSASHFISRYKKIKGITPSKFRESVREFSYEAKK